VGNPESFFPVRSAGREKRLFRDFFSIQDRGSNVTGNAVVFLHALTEAPPSHQIPCSPRTLKDSTSYHSMWRRGNPAPFSIVTLSRLIGNQLTNISTRKGFLQWSNQKAFLRTESIILFFYKRNGRSLSRVSNRLNILNKENTESGKWSSETGSHPAGFSCSFWGSAFLRAFSFSPRGFGSTAQATQMLSS